MPEKDDRDRYLFSDADEQRRWGNEPSPHPEIPAASIEPSFLTVMFGTSGFTWTEGTIDGQTQKQLGIELSPDGTLIFDREKLDEAQEKLVGKILEWKRTGAFRHARSRLEQGHPPQNECEQFLWYFMEETPDFFDELIKKITEKDPTVLKDLNLNERLQAAADSIRELAKRREIRETMQKQYRMLPFNFGNEMGVDYVFVSTPEGPELLISARPGTQGFSELHVLPERLRKDKFKLDPSSVRKKVDIDNSEESGKNNSHWEFKVLAGEETGEPIFKTVRVLIQPRDLGKTLDDLAEEKRLKEEAERQRKAQAAQPYSPTPPSVPTVTPPAPPRYTAPAAQPVRSG